ncbi:ATP-grasp domain-containing protein [Sporosarcina saromensis]|uniref:ATP-grasp domain-containing protein n=1 Tax=Sporosarcina saromensis TaxID=359365 RepID=A0ABU4G7Q9_9BACL|nr:ATP-grasp domain-containing protein [Sporosarcina saromensis]MDW0112397.1 ATP-grasp domain-containing protein [Sporosarcina saromensis]
MKGYLYYSSIEAKRNYAFIEDLQQHAKSAGISLQLIVDDEQPSEGADFVLFRDRTPALAYKWESMGHRVINRSQVNEIANDKLKTYEFVSLLGIRSVPTKKLRTIDEIDSYPVVLKSVDGYGGNNVYLCHSRQEALDVSTQNPQLQFIYQPFIETNAQDVRVFMLGDEVLGAVKRTGVQSFKSNFTLGGTVEKYCLSYDQVTEVQQIARALKSDYIGIDFLLRPDGSWLLNEIEDPVGARSLYVTHDFSVAEKLIAYIMNTLK